MRDNPPAPHRAATPILAEPMLAGPLFSIYSQCLAMA